MKNKCSHYAYLFVLSVLVSLAASRNSMAANRPADVGFNVSLESSSYNSATNKSTFLYKITQKESQLTGLSHFIIQNFCLPTGETNIKGENSPNGSSEWETISADKMNTSDGSTTECQDGFGSLLKFNYNGGGRTNYYRLTIKGHFIPTDGQSILRWGGTSGTVTCAKVAVQVPTPVVNKQTVYVCQNSSTTLSARTGSNYKWTLNGSSLTDVSSSISASTGGEYQVIYDASNCRSIELFTLQVRDLPTLSVTNTSICPSANGTLTASGASSYSWSNAATSASITVSPSSTTTYTVTGTDANGCQNTASGTVTVYKLPTISVNSPSICIGGSSNLTASGATTYAWSNSQSGSTINVSPTTTSSYTVTGTDANGCSNTASATVTVHLLPTVTATQNQTVCAGSKVTLTGAGASSYSWNNGITNGTEFTATKTKTYTVTGTDANGCTNTATSIVTVNALPTVTATQNQTVCAGSKVTLTGAGASSYAWNNGITNGTEFTATETKTYTVTGTDANGCTNTATSIVTVNALPTITVNSPNICAGNSTTLTASGANSYSWSNAGVGNSITVSPGSTTNYSVIGTSNGCTGSAVATVTVNPIPSVSVSKSSLTVCTNNSIDLNLAGGSPSNGTWSISSGGGSINQNTFMASNNSGNVVLRYEYSNGTCSNVTTMSISVSNCQVLCTYTQGYYGNTGGMSCNGIDPETGNSLGQSTTLERLKSAFNTAGVAEIVFGDKSKGKFFILRSSDVASTSSNIFKMLPGGGTPTSLNANANGWNSTASSDAKSPVNNKGKIVNNLLSQSITLWLNIKTSARLGSWTLPKSFKTVKPECGTTKIDGLTPTNTVVTPSLVGYSVNDLMVLANRALGGTLNANDPSLNDIFNTVDQINNAFDQCRYLVSQEAPNSYKTASSREEAMFRTVSENTDIVSTVVAYPNPFVGKVSFLIKAKLNGRATLGLYNLTGLKIADLFDGEMTENQEKQIEFFVPSGNGLQTYLYLFEQSGQMIRGKIVGE